MLNITKPLQAVTACKGKTLGGYTMQYDEKQKQRIYKYRRENPDSTKNRITITLGTLDKELMQKVASHTGETRSELVRRLVTEEAHRLKL